MGNPLASIKLWKNHPNNAALIVFAALFIPVGSVTIGPIAMKIFEMNGMITGLEKENEYLSQNVEILQAENKATAVMLAELKVHVSNLGETVLVEGEIWEMRLDSIDKRINGLVTSVQQSKNNIPTSISNLLSDMKKRYGELEDNVFKLRVQNDNTGSLVTRLMREQDKIKTSNEIASQMVELERYHSAVTDHMTFLKTHDEGEAKSRYDSAKRKYEKALRLGVKIAAEGLAQLEEDYKKRFP